MILRAGWRGNSRTLFEHMYEFLSVVGFRVRAYQPEQLTMTLPAVSGGVDVDENAWAPDECRLEDGLVTRTRAADI